MDNLTESLGKAGPILAKLRENGHRALLVGGAVRDMLLHMPPQDLDILTDASPEQVLSLFAGENSKLAGKAFPVCLVKGIEVCSGQPPAESGAVFPENDLGRRDFTINAMAFDPGTNTLMDPFGGKSDLDRGIIRFTRNPGDRILEDPVRMIRACRFAARFKAALDPSSREAISAHAGLMDSRIPGERIRAEIIKAMAMEKPSGFFFLLHSLGLLRGMLPSLNRCAGLDGGPFHSETVFDHCMLVGDDLPARSPLLRFAGYVHDTGKFDAIGIKEGRITFHGHETHCTALEKDLEALRFSRQEKEYILSLVKVHMRPLVEKTTPKSVRKLLVLLEESGISYRDFLRMRIADKKGNLSKSPYTLSQIRLRLQKIRDEITTRAAFNLNDLAVDGEDIIEVLEIEPGPEVGRIKELLFEKVLENPALNSKKYLVHLLTTLTKKDD
ncbi:CCA tRNA nucleotidyltransferase [Desulfospira joergensenii]|uniref:CCA tRNA nucleotidyltransferase n=1 Tax=Desulfospira joergensenii TaxID=53329 RepID=UPI00041B40E7|nr:CCA tRNA nucleotidyltransferase [Desulfospira joergensenii]